MSSSSGSWQHTQERGSVAGIRLLVFLATRLGRKPLRPLLWLIATWYALLHAPARQASRQWLQRVWQREPKFHEIIRHFYVFAQTALDRAFLLAGRSDLFVIRHFGAEHLAELSAKKQGAILLSAHLGSPAAMAAEGRDENLRIHIVGYFRNARMFNDALTAINPQYGARLVHIEPGETSTILEMRDRVESGDLLALSGDRAGLTDRLISANFLGNPAQFPAGPFLFAAMMHCPVYLAFGLYREPNAYDLYCEPFADRVELPRGSRESALQALIQRYADRVAHFAVMEPYNWFNFHDFWRQS